MGINDARDLIMDWIALNYYDEMEGLLLADGYECARTEDPPWYETNCPRSHAMEVHNEAMTRLIEKGERTDAFGPLGKRLLLGTLKLKMFSERDIERQRKVEGKP